MGYPWVSENEKLMQKLTSMDASSTLHDAVMECHVYEAAKSTTSTLRDPTTVCAVSQNRKDRKGVSMAKASSHTATPLHKAPCSNCGKEHALQACPATKVVCHGCDHKHHWSHMAKCPASTAICGSCDRYGHFAKFCSTETKPKGPKGHGKLKPTLNVICSQSLDRPCRSGQQRASYIRRPENGS